MNFLLTNQVALITGAHGDISRAVALGLAESGAHVALCDVPGHPLKELADQIRQRHRQALVLEVNCEDAGDIQRAVAECVRLLSRLDILVNNLVIEEKIPFLKVPVESWDRQFDSNARAPFLFAQAAAREMVRSGRGVIINIGSVAGEVFWPNTAPYNASRGALKSLTGTLGLELASRGVRVNGIAAGHIETELEREKLSNPAVQEGSVPILVGN